MKPSDEITILSPNTLLKSPSSNYQIDCVLGHGTFGITYKAKIIEGKRKGKFVSIKEFFIDGISSREESGIVSSCSDTVSIEQCKSEFVAEANNLIILNHPNIVKAYEVFEANGTVYYSMEYIEGENLNSYIKNVKLTPDEAVKIITKIAYGLSYMHESRHMLHLDLKPGNVMRRSSDGQIIIIDFGLSRYFTEEEMPETAASIGLGTKGYAPIEQIEFKRIHKDFKATIDVYALGATFYKLVTGKTPPSSKELKADSNLLHDSLSPIELSESKKRIIEKAMSLLPDKRYQSVMDFIYDINAEERKRRKKGCLFSFLIMVGLIIIGSIGFKLYKNHKDGKQTYYKELGGYAFELIDANQGANHYGEIEYYKFFSNGTGVYMFESWHDPMDCHDPECNLESFVDTLSFRYDVVNYDMLVFERNPKSYSSYYDEKQQTYIMLLPEEKKIFIHEENYPLQVNEETINWDEAIKIRNKEWKRKQ